MKTLNICLNKDNEILNRDDIFNLHVHLNKIDINLLDEPFTIRFDDDTSFARMLNECSKFTDCNYMLFNIFDVDIDRKLIDEAEGYDISYQYSKIEGIDVPTALVVKASLVKENRFNDRFSYLFLNEYINRFGGALKIQSILKNDEIRLNDELKNEYDSIEISSILGIKNKRVIYTFANNDVDLPVMHNKNAKYDYVCFTNSTTMNSKDWMIINSNFSREFVKMCPQYFLSNYEKSIWLDPKCEVISTDLDELVDSFNDDVLTLENEEYESIYDFLKTKNEDAFNKFKVHLIINDAPKSIKMPDTSVIVRNHNNDACIYMMENWIKMKYEYDIDDDSSFSYSAYKNECEWYSIPGNLMNGLYVRTQ